MPSRLHRLSRASWVGALIAINLIVLFNAIVHDPFVGYDASDHLKYIETLSQLRLPLRSDTLEFFSPPLPYLAPAMLRSTGLVSLRHAGKAAQLLNVLFSIGVTLCIVKLCERARPGDDRLKLLSLLSLGMLPVYYKTFAFVRGEPLLALITLVVIDRALSVTLGAGAILRGALALGGALGLAVLSRQWGFFLFPAVAAFGGLACLWGAARWKRTALAVTASFLVAAVVGGWFYIHLRQTFGTLRAFNRTPSPSFTLSNQTPEFYTGLGLEDLFSDPVRRAFHNQFLPIFYSEVWGDYWITFIVNGRDLRDGRPLSGGALFFALEEKPPPDWLRTNRHEVSGYLGRANLAGLAPSAILLAGVVLGGVMAARRSAWSAGTPSTHLAALLFLVVGFSVLGYFWFLVMYPRADTIKATYLLQICAPAAIVCGELMLRARNRSVFLYAALVLLLLLPLLHNAPLLVTRYFP